MSFISEGRVLRYLGVLTLLTLGASFNLIFTLLAMLLALVLIIKSDMQGLVEIQLVLVSFAALMFVFGSVSLLNIVFLASALRALQLNKWWIPRQVLWLALVLLAVGSFGLIRGGISVLPDMLVFDLQMVTAGLALFSGEKLDVCRLVRVYAIALIASSVVCLCSDYLPGVGSYIREVTFRYSSAGDRVNRLAGLMGNPNYYTVSLNVAIAVLLNSVLAKKGGLIDWILTCLLVAFGMLSLSKSFALTLILTVAIIVVVLLLARPTKTVGFLFLCVIIMCLCSAVVGNLYLELLVDRLLPSTGGGLVDLNTYSTNRLDKFDLYLTYFGNHVDTVVFGNGFGSTIQGQASHNMYLEMLFYFGIVGCMLLGIWFAYAHRSLKRGCGMLRFLPLIVLLVRGLAINMWIAVSFPFYLIIVLLEMSETLSAESLSNKEASSLRPLTKYRG